MSPEELDFVSAVCLDPSRGVARALMERCIENARAHGGVSVLAYDGDKWFVVWVLGVKFYPTNQPKCRCLMILVVWFSDRCVHYSFFSPSTCGRFRCKDRSIA